MSGFKAVIFDFNGTLFPDTEHNLGAWIKFSPTVKGETLTMEQAVMLNGKSNKETLAWIKGAPVTDEELEKWSEMKEVCYRQTCLDSPETFHLASGAVELLDFLKAHNVKIGIASMCGQGNMDFYKKHFGLLKWFDPSHIVIDTGDIPSKPDPAIYVKAMKSLGVTGSECIVIEDSMYGLESARRAGAGYLYAIGPPEKHEILRKVEGVTAVISDFVQFDRSLLDLP